MATFFSRLIVLIMVWSLVGMNGSAWADKPLKSLSISSPASKVSQQQSLQLLKAEERTLDGRPALGLLFSQKLDPTQLYDGFLSVFATDDQKVSGGWVLADDQRTLLFPHVSPKTHYTIQIQKGLPAKGKTVLDKTVKQTITTRSLKPAYDFAGRGLVLPTGLTLGLPLLTVNVPEVDLEFLKVKEGALGPFLKKHSWSNSGSHWDTQLDRMAPHIESVFMARFQTNVEKNRRGITHISVESIPQLKEPGLYIAVMSRPGRFGKFKTTHFFVSDIGLHLRMYDQTMAVYASSLKTGKPLANVEFSLIDGKGITLQKGLSDVQGRVQLNKPNKGKGHLIVGHRNQDITLLPLLDPALDLSEFDRSGPSFKKVESFLYLPRDLYRPGERVDFSVLLRNHDGQKVEDQPLSVRFRRPDGKELTRMTVPPMGLGYYQGDTLLPSDAMTGRWFLELRVDPGSKKPDRVIRFHVEEFLPERMKLELTAPQQPAQGDEPWMLEVLGAYLHGAPADGNRLKVVAHWKKEDKPLSQWPKFYFGNASDPFKPKRSTLFDHPLDAKGSKNLPIPPLNKALSSPVKITLTADLFESGGRPVTRSTSRMIWPSETLTGVRPLYSGEYAQSHSDAVFEVVKVNKVGESVGVDGLDVKVIREARNYYWTYDESRGWNNAFSESEYPIFQTTLNIVPGKTAQIQVPVEYGSYRLEIFDLKTSKTSSYRFQAGWNWRDKESSSQPRPDRVNLQLDKKSYKPGDTAHLTIIPPHPGEGLVLVESKQGLLWGERIFLPKKGLVVDIPIADDWNRHDMYSSVVSFRPGNAHEKITPNRAIGLIHLPLDRDDRRLQIRLDAPEKITPNGPLKVIVHVNNLNNETAMVTVAAVDVGVLNITDMKSPDPFDFFFSKRLFDVELRDIYGKVIENLEGVLAKQSFGGDAPNQRRGEKPRSKVRIISLFSGPITIDEQGQAKIILPVGDFNGALRIMAVAFSEDRFGSNHQEVLVAAPLIAEISTPRFLAAGDTSRLTLELRNNTGGDTTFELQLSAEKPLLLEPVHQTIHLKDKKHTILSFPLSAEGGEGVGLIKLGLKGESFHLNRQWSLMVRSPYPLSRIVKRFTLNFEGESFLVDPTWAKEFIPETTVFYTQLSTHPPFNARNAIRGLLTYPYGCLEQTTSRAFPLLYVDEEKAKQLKLTPLSWQERNSRLQSAFKRLSGMQLTSGGFGLWNKNSPEEIWLTPYVTDFLLQAREAGFSVPERMLKKALNNLSNQIRRRVFSSPHHTNHPEHRVFAAQAYAAYVLAKVNLAPLGLLRTLFDQDQEKAQSGLPLIHLGLALKLQGDAKHSHQAFSKGLSRVRNDTLYLGDYGSQVRDLSLIWGLLNTIKLDKTQRHLHNNILVDLDRLMVGRTYLSTQEKFALFFASLTLDDQNDPTPWQFKQTIESVETVEHRVGDWNQLYTLDQLKTSFSLTSSFKKPLYGEVEISGYPQTMPKAKSDPIQIQRDYFQLDGQPIQKLHFKTGDMAVVRLSVSSSQKISHGLIEDLLPSGFEIENPDLGKGEKLSNSVIEGESPSKLRLNKDIVREEFREDRYMASAKLSPHTILKLFYLVRAVTPGSYTIPPPFAEDMYRPDRFGMGESGGTLIIEDP